MAYFPKERQEVVGLLIPVLLTKRNEEQDLLQGKERGERSICPWLLIRKGLKNFILMYSPNEGYAYTKIYCLRMKRSPLENFRFVSIYEITVHCYYALT